MILCLFMYGCVFLCACVYVCIYMYMYRAWMIGCGS